MIRRTARRVHELLRRRNGSVAVEFALVATPFLFLLFAIIEIGMIFVTNVSLYNSTLALTRQLRTGAVMAGGTAVTTSSGYFLSLTDFKTALCKNMGLVTPATCANQLQVDVRPLTGFSNSATNNPLSNSGFTTTNLCYYSGASGSIVEFRAYYLWPISTPLILTPLVNATSYTVGNVTTRGNYFVLNSTEFFVVENNSSGANTGNGC